MAARRDKKNRRELAKQAQASIGIQVQQMTAFSGPLPPPETLAKYNEIVPGSAERIISMAEKQSDHRMGLENKALHWDIVRSNWGLAIGGVICLAFLAVSGFVIYEGHDWAAAMLGGVDLASIAGIFVIGTAMQRSERRQRLELMTGQKLK